MRRNFNAIEKQRRTRYQHSVPKDDNFNPIALLKKRMKEPGSRADSARQGVASHNISDRVPRKQD